jgi:hypothetical protein
MFSSSWVFHLFGRKTYHHNTKGVVARLSLSEFTKLRFIELGSTQSVALGEFPKLQFYSVVRYCIYIKRRP